MKAIWIDYGNDADALRLKGHGVEAPYYDIRDPRITKTYLQNVRAQGFKPGVYAAWAWPEVAHKSGAGFAEWVSDQLQRVAPGTGNDFPRVSLNIETHDVSYILAALKRWRELRPTRTTDWTLEGHQGGLFKPADVQAIVAANVEICPQAYTGDMRRYESDRVVLDLVKHGFPADRIHCFYDAAQVGHWWDGVLFTQGRLP